MSKIEIIKNEDNWYELDKCPFGFKFPLACQVKGCPQWKGYTFTDAKYLGFKDYVSSSWRKMINGDIRVANFVKCEFLQTDKETGNET